MPKIMYTAISYINRSITQFVNNKKVIQPEYVCAPVNTNVIGMCVYV